MRGVFDEREAERERRKRGREARDRDDGREEKRDREVTLGWYTLLAIFFALVMVCGLSFGLGYVVGRREPAAKSTVLEPTPVAGQGEGAKAKASGGPGSVAASNTGGGAAEGSPSLEGAAESGQHAGGLPSGSDASDAGAGAGEQTTGTQRDVQSPGEIVPVEPARPTVSDANKPQPAAKNPQQTPVRSVQPALESATKKTQEAAPDALMVRVATLAHQEDADVLVEALRRRGYAVSAHRDVVDGMVHVRVGPFASRDVANQWRQKLLNDGYNAVVEAQ